MGAERRALVASLLLEEVVAHENLVAIELQRRAVLTNQVARHDDLVEKVPLAVVEQRALSHLVERVVPRIVEVGRMLHLLRFAHTGQFLRHALVVRVVVQVTHDHHLRFGMLLHQRQLQLLHLESGPLASLAARPARWPVAHDEDHRLAGQPSLHHQEATRDVSGVALQSRFGLHRAVSLHAESEQGVVHIALFAIVERHQHAALQLEELGIVEEGTLDAAAVGAGIVHILPSALLERRLLEQVVQHMLVLHLGHAHHGRAAGQLVGAKLRKHAGHVVQFGLILHLAPLVGARGEILVVVLSRIVQRVEQIFKVVERHAVERIALLLLSVPREGTQRADTGQHDSQSENQSFHEYMVYVFVMPSPRRQTARARPLSSANFTKKNDFSYSFPHRGFIFHRNVNERA